MTEKEALRILNLAGRAKRKMVALQYLAEQIRVPIHTVYSWHRKGKIPAWRLAQFETLRKRKAA